MNRRGSEERSLCFLVPSLSEYHYLASLDWPFSADTIMDSANAGLERTLSRDSSTESALLVEGDHAQSNVRSDPAFPRGEELGSAINNRLDRLKTEVRSIVEAIMPRDSNSFPMESLESQRLLHGEIPSRQHPPQADNGVSRVNIAVRQMDRLYRGEGHRLRWERPRQGIVRYFLSARSPTGPELLPEVKIATFHWRRRIVIRFCMGNAAALGRERIDILVRFEITRAVIAGELTESTGRDLCRAWFQGTR